MKESENLYDKIKEMFGQDPGTFSIMEDKIDIDLQVEYFEFSKRVSQEYDDDWALDQVDLLDDPDYAIEGKKLLLARLATMENVMAYRTLENYTRNPDDGLSDWSKLALQESRMHIESDLMEENQIFISTGLGGKNNKLRYFVVLIERNKKEFSDFQKSIIEKEFPFTLKKYGVEVEEFDCQGYLATFMLLMPIQYAVKHVFLEGIQECNQYGEFLRENCIVTNVKKLTFEEVVDFIEQKNA